MPDQAAFDAVLIGTSRASAERRFGCPGIVVDPNLASAGDLMLQWQAADHPERTVQLRFDTTGVFYKTATELDTASGPSSCVPTQERFDSLPPASTAADAARWFGCAGQHVGTLETLGYRDDRYRWGRDAAGQPLATVQFANGYVIAKQASGLR